MSTTELDSSQEQFFHSLSVLKGFDSLRQNGLLFDVTLVVQGQKFPAHRAILAASCSYFWAMFTDGMKEATQSEIHIEVVSATGMNLILNYLYSGCLDLDFDNIQDSLSAACFLQVIPVVNQCVEFLQKHLRPENCLDVICIADMYSLKDLENCANQLLCANFQKFSNTPDFSKLTFNQLKRILMSDYPVDCSEDTILKTLLRWISNVKNLTMTQVNQLLQNIHFECVDSGEKNVKRINEGTPIKPYEDRKLPFLINGRGIEQSIIAIGGYGPKSASTQIIYFQSSYGQWRHLTTMPEVCRHYYGSTIYNNRIYVTGGSTSRNIIQFTNSKGFVYDAESNLWSKIKNMNLGRNQHTLTAVGNKIYAIGGNREVTEFNYRYGDDVYNPITDNWIKIKSIPEHRFDHAATAAPHNAPYLYVSGGIGLTSVTILDSMWRLNTETLVWNRCANMLTPRAHHVMLTIGDKIYVCDGWSQSNMLCKTIEAYDVKTDSWHIVTQYELTPASIFTVDGNIYFQGELRSPSQTNKTASTIGVTFYYNTENNTWSNQCHFPYLRNIAAYTCAILYLSRHRNDDDVKLIIPKQ